MHNTGRKDQLVIIRSTHMHYGGASWPTLCASSAARLSDRQQTDRVLFTAAVSNPPGRANQWKMPWIMCSLPGFPRASNTHFGTVCPFGNTHPLSRTTNTVTGPARAIWRHRTPTTNHNEQASLNIWHTQEDTKSYHKEG